MQTKKTIKKGDEGYLTISHYKEPLRAVAKADGFGFYGALNISIDGEYIQCHICGELFSQLGVHARMKHKVPEREYRQRFMLSGKTALISEKMRAQMKQRTLDWQNGLTRQQRKDLKRRALEGIKLYRRNIALGMKRISQPLGSLEQKNKRGTCPDQLLDKISRVAIELGRTPSLAEFIDITGTQRYKHLIFKVFGSWLKALEMLKLQPHIKSENGGMRKYSNEELLEYMACYAEGHRAIPTATDCKRKLLPSFEVYTTRFGSFEKARQLAGVYDILEEEEKAKFAKREYLKVNY